MKQFGNLTIGKSVFYPNFPALKSTFYFCFSNTMAVRAGMYNRK